MAMKKVPALKVDTKPPVAEKPYQITDSGTFSEGSLIIGKNGILIGGESPKTSEDAPQLSSPRGVKELNDFKMLKNLGQGSGGVVRKALHMPSNQLVALKVVTLDISDQTRKHIISELKSLYRNQSEYVVSFLDAFYTEGSIFIALEYMDGGSLADLLKARGTIEEKLLACITSQVLKGLTYLQKTLHIIHRDIKTPNILLNTKGKVKIADFGVSSQLEHTKGQAITWVGTSTYMSPERISGKPYSFNSDIWSLGITLVECALGKYPYSMGTTNAETGKPFSYFDLLQAVVESPAPTLPADKFSPAFCSFVGACLQKDPARRANAEALLRHEFILKADKIDLSKYVEPLSSSTG